MVAVALLCSVATAAETGPSRVYRFADRTVDIGDDASVAAAFELPAGSRLVPHLKPLLAAVIRHPAARPSLDDATNPTHRYSFRTAVHWMDSVAAAAFVHGLRRVDDETLLAVRPVMARIWSAARGCGADRAPDRVQFVVERLSEDESIVLLDAWTRAVDAVNARKPVVPVDEGAVEAAMGRAVGRLTPAELHTAASFDPEAVLPVDCGMMEIVAKMQLEGPREDAPLLMRQLFGDYALDLQATRVYAPGDDPRCPPEGITARASGEQTVRLDIDPQGHVVRVSTTAHRFTPETIVRADGSEIATNDLYLQEVVAYMKTKTYPKAAEGRTTNRVFEIPFKWTIED